MKRLVVLHFFLCFIFMACRQDHVLNIPLKNLKGDAVTLNVFMNGKKGMILIFLAPDCPLSQYYSLPLRNFYEKHGQHIAFAGIIPGKDFGIEEIVQYKERYLIPMELLMDEELKLTRKLKASITPEVFLLNEKSEMVYSGAIDDAAADLTVKRQVVRQHYLKDAVESLINHQPLKVSRTKAVGCFIERKK